MKTIVKSLAILTAGCLGVSAQTTEKKTEVTKHADGSVTKTETTVFNSDARTKVVQYFDPYKADPYGMPPQWVSKAKLQHVPPSWRGMKISSGTVVAEKERTYLIDAPPELISALPAPREGVHYYVAGSNVIAVDPSYRVVDSVHIPSIKFEKD